MHKTARLFDIRVAVFLLIPAVGVVAAPSDAASDSRRAAVSESRLGPADEVNGLKRAASATSSTLSAFDAATWDDVDLGLIDRKVFSLALTSAASAVEGGEAEPATLTVIDFSRPSTSRRMWVYDLRSRELLFEEHVAHGRNSGHNLTNAFSNEPESHKSSLGLYRAAEGYVGKHGYSLRLDGLEAGFNDRARERAIVIHGAEYVNAKTAQAQGRLGRSLGCPAVRREIAGELIDAIKGGGLVFAYYPDPAWLNASTYLN